MICYYYFFYEKLVYKDVYIPEGLDISPCGIGNTLFGLDGISAVSG